MVANLDAKMLRFMSADEFRVLMAAEMGMKNHEIVPTSLIESIAGLKRGGVFKLISQLAKYKLIAHSSIPYDGYRLTSKGYDYLALKAFSKRGTLAAMGIQIGVGKESDIFTVMRPEGCSPQEVCCKLHRLGRTCFRTVKNNRDYMRNGQAHASWMYLSRLSALKEYAFMKALHTHGFPVPTPIDVNRHCVIMTLASGYQLNSINCLTHPGRVFNKLMDIIIRLAEHGLIHGDFNEFNLMVDDDENVTVIDFPQMISTSHINAEYYFNRDVQGVKTFFKRRFHFDAVHTPTLADDTTRGANREKGAAGLDEELRASGWTETFSKDFDGLMSIVEQHEAEGGGEEEEEEEGEEDEDDESDDEEAEEARAKNPHHGPGPGTRAPLHSGQGILTLEATSAAAAAAAAAAAGTSSGGSGGVELGRADEEVDGLVASPGVDADVQRAAELDDLKALAQLARPMAGAPDGVAAPAAGAQGGGAAGAAPLVMVDLSDALGAKLPTTLPLQPAARDGEATPSEAPSGRSMCSTSSSVRGMTPAAILERKERIKRELAARARKQAGGRSTRNESKDKELRKLKSQVKSEASGGGAW